MPIHPLETVPVEISFILTPSHNIWYIPPSSIILPSEIRLLMVSLFCPVALLLFLALVYVLSLLIWFVPGFVIFTFPVAAAVVHNISVNTIVRSVHVIVFS